MFALTRPSNSPSKVGHFKSPGKLGFLSTPISGASGFLLLTRPRGATPTATDCGPKRHLRSSVPFEQLRMKVALLMLLSHVTIFTISAAPWYFLPQNISTLLDWIDEVEVVLLDSISQIDATLSKNYR